LYARDESDDEFRYGNLGESLLRKKTLTKRLFSALFISSSLETNNFDENDRNNNRNNENNNSVSRFSL